MLAVSRRLRFAALAATHMVSHRKGDQRMTWVRFDDTFPIHRKVAGLKDGAYRVHTEAIFWCSRNTTDGIIRATEIGQIRNHAGRYVAEIVDHEVWHPADQVCAECADNLTAAGRSWPPDGWVIHDYLKFQPSRAQVTRDREAKAKRQSRWRSSKGHVDAPVDASLDALVTPAPPRPAPKEAGLRPERSAGRAVPAASGRPVCPKHLGQPANNCALCRSESLAGDGSP